MRCERCSIIPLRAIVVCWVLTLIQPLWALTPVEKETLSIYERSARIISRQLPKMHISRAPLDDERARQGFTLFLTTLDHDRSYFMASDVEHLRHLAGDLAGRLRKGDLQPAFDVYDLLMERVDNRLSFVEELLENGFNLDEPGSYVWQRRDEPWPADRREWDALWRDKVRHLYVGRMVARMLSEEEQETSPSTPDDPVGRPRPEEKKNGARETLDAPAIPGDETLRLSPEEQVLRHFRQYREVLHDNDAHWLLALYLNSFAQAYDPHTNYLSADNTEDFDIQMRLSLVGIGALLSREDGAAKVERILPGGPAERDGRLQPGDRIIAVAQEGEDAVDVLHWPLSRTVRLIRGEKDTLVTLTVVPAADVSGSRVTRIELVRDEVRLEERAARGSLHLPPAKEGDGTLRLGVISVPDFYADMRARGSKEARSVTRDVETLLRELDDPPLDGLVLDLRNNGGGSLPEALDMTGLFIESGPVVQVRNQGGVAVLSDADPEALYYGPLLVLINRQSASASEILAAALKDHGRALVVGDSKTHGKGTVQRMEQLHKADEALGSLKVTTETFYRIAGGSTQREGVTPHIHLPSPLEAMRIGEEFLPHALPWSTVRPALYRSDRQLERYVPELRNRSRERCLNDDDFQTYYRLIDNMTQRRQARTVPLDLNSRLAMAREERALADYLARWDPDEENTESSEDAQHKDLVLEESLRILQDWVHMERSAETLLADK